MKSFLFFLKENELNDFVYVDDDDFFSGWKPGSLSSKDFGKYSEKAPSDRKKKRFGKLPLVKTKHYASLLCIQFQW